MIERNRYIAFLTIMLMLSNLASSQAEFVASVNDKDTPKACTPPKNYEIFHDYVDREQKNILRLDGKTDNLYTPSTNEEINFLVTQSLVSKVDAIQCQIETDSSVNRQDKVRYLRGIENVLKFYNNNVRQKKVKAVFLPDIIRAYETAIAVDKSGNSIEPMIRELPYEVGYSIVYPDRTTFVRNPGYKSSLQNLVLKYCTLHPERTFQTLKEDPDLPFTDSLIRIVSKKYPRQLYDYAAANNRLSNVIRNIQDDVFIKSVVRMASSKSGQQYFPFLDNLVKGKMSFAEIDDVKDDSLQYYKLLVKTQIDYVERAINKDTAMEFKSLTAKLTNRARDVFVTTINGLHNEN
ncbi:MAG TPA: hypothetical protein VFO70_08220, partial [Chitinophagaceae bacterium]|nr:hypothetical protein [Chitinophagaceae bacterium]